MISLVLVGVLSVPIDPSMVMSSEESFLEKPRTSLNDGLAEGAEAAIPLFASTGSVGEMLKSMEASIF